MIDATVSAERGWLGVFRGRSGLGCDCWLIRIPCEVLCKLSGKLAFPARSGHAVSDVGASSWPSPTREAIAASHGQKLSVLPEVAASTAPSAFRANFLTICEACSPANRQYRYFCVLAVAFPSLTIRPRGLKYTPCRWYMDAIKSIKDRNMSVHEIRPKLNDSEKVTINLGLIDLG
ncbi:MAG: hypothetical protein ACTS5Y_12185, partial [Pollutimonas bauzanensis]